MRRFFRFSIRDLLWLTLVVALGLGWGIREWKLRDDAIEAKSDLAHWKDLAEARYTPHQLEVIGELLEMMKTEAPAPPPDASTAVVKDGADAPPQRNPSN
jgi:hypothetical protein